jgi:hypothetical protein
MYDLITEKEILYSLSSEKNSAFDVRFVKAKILYGMDLFLAGSILFPLGRKQPTSKQRFPVSNAENVKSFAKQILALLIPA